MIMLRVGIQEKPPLLQMYILPSGPSAAPFGPPGIFATTSLRPSGQTRVSRWPRISTNTTEPSGITTGPSGNSRSVARTRILAMKNPPGSLGCGRIFGEPPRATFSLRMLWQNGSGLPSKRGPLRGAGLRCAERYNSWRSVQSLILHRHPDLKPAIARGGIEFLVIALKVRRVRNLQPRLRQPLITDRAHP